MALVLILVDEGQGGHHFLLEKVPLGDRVVEFGFWKVNEHPSDFWSSLVTHKLFYMLINSVTNDVLFLGLLRGLEILRHEH